MSLLGSAAIIDADTLWRALKRLPPRTEQLLLLRFVDGLSDPECADRYGISPKAWAVQLLRASRLLVRALDHPRGPPLLPTERPSPLAVEEGEAIALVTALEAVGARPEAPSVAELVAPLRVLAAHRDEVRVVMDARAREVLASPEYRRNEHLRRLALVTLIGAALWLHRDELLRLLE